jgi:hypothetical protein
MKAKRAASKPLVNQAVLLARARLAEVKDERQP